VGFSPRGAYSPATPSRERTDTGCYFHRSNNKPTRATIIPVENAADYSQLWDELEADWYPQTRTEGCYLETMATSRWLV